MNFDDPKLYSDLDDSQDTKIVIKNPQFCKYFIIVLLIILAVLILHCCSSCKNIYDDNYVYSFGPDVKFNKTL